MKDKHIIIVLLSVILVIICCGIAYNLLAENTKYVSINIAESGTTLEIPDDMTIKSNDAESGITVLGNDNTIVVWFNSQDKSVSQILEFASVKNPIFGNEFDGNVTVSDPNLMGFSLNGQCNGVFISNNDTHDNIIVFSKSKDILDYIINSIDWGNKTVSNSDDAPSSSSSSESSSSQPSAYAYKSDGTPMYNEKEVQEYMGNKYGMVEYHIGDNGYIDMDEPGFDDAGHYVGY